MNIVSVENNWNANTLKIHINLGNICNYQCSYCWPESHAGTDYWPDLELIKINTAHLIRYYIEHSNKEIFDIHFEGGEPTHWPKLIDYVKFLKDNFNCLISMHSNGSKKLEYWEDIAPYFDSITLSGHNEFMDKTKFRDVCDLLYEHNVLVSVNMMMNPPAWNECMDIVSFLKKSKHQWVIRYREVLGANVQYTTDQIEILKKQKARSSNIFWFLKNNKYYNSRVKVTDSNGKIHKFKDNELVLKRLNQFNGWMCSLGVDWLHINRSGSITGVCGQPTLTPMLNFYSTNFKQEFTPEINYTLCTKESCWCGTEVNMKKFKYNTKVIPILNV